MYICMVTRYGEFERPLPACQLGPVHLQEWSLSKGTWQGTKGVPQRENTRFHREVEGPSWLRNPDGSSYFHVLFLFDPLYDEVPILGIAQKRPHSLIQKFVHRFLGKGIRPVLSRRARWYWMQSEIFPWKRAQEGGILCAKPEVIRRNSGFQLSQKLYEIVYIHMLEILCQICRPFIYVSWLVFDHVLGLHSWSPGNRSPTGDCPAPVEQQFLNQENVFFFFLNVPSGYD